MFAQIAGNARPEFQNFPGEDAPVPATNYVAELIMIKHRTIETP